MGIVARIDSSHAPAVPVRDLPGAWLARAAELEPYAPPAAAAYRKAAQELREQLDASDDSVTLREAHALGGYSIDHLQRVVKAGTIQNVGSKGRIRIRRSEVPVKPGHVGLRVETRSRSFRPSAVVASAIARDIR